MSPRDEPASTAYWERTLPALARALRESLRRRMPSLAQLHDDLVNDALLGLAERVRTQPALCPVSWLRDEDPEDEVDREHLTRLAHAILRRRAADLFRKRAREWALRVDTGDAPAESLGASSEVSAERRDTAGKLLRVCVGVIAELSDEDRALLLQSAGVAGGEDRALTDRERQRLRRARQRLHDAVRERLGAEALELLETDPE